MNLPLAPDTATHFVVWGALLIGLVLGAAGQASRFCVRGAIADWFLYGGRSRMMVWVLVVVVAALGSQAVIGLTSLQPERTLAWSDRCRVLYRDFGIDYVAYALGTLADRCFVFAPPG